MPRIQLNSLKEPQREHQRRERPPGRTPASQALDDAASARERIEVLQPLSVVLPPTGLPAGKTVLRIDAASVGFEPGRPVIRDLSFTITGPERIAVTGPNGSGKTTLLALVTGRLRAVDGNGAGHDRLRHARPAGRPARSVGTRSATISGASIRQADENACRAALARFMFRADAALQIVSSLSGGQLLRAGLACVLGGATPPPLLILDEPTNHLDIEFDRSGRGGIAGL